MKIFLQFSLYYVGKTSSLRSFRMHFAYKVAERLVTVIVWPFLSLRKKKVL